MRIDGITRLPARLLSFTSADGELVPTWFGDRDRPWLRDLLDDAEALAGQPFEVWRRRWARGDPDPRAGRTRQRIAVHVLAAWLKRRSRTPPRSELRRTLFELGASGVPREAALAVDIVARVHVKARGERPHAELVEDDAPAPVLVDGVKGLRRTRASRKHGGE